MAIRCGCCGGEHQTAAEVRACCDGSPAAKPDLGPGIDLPIVEPQPAEEPATVAKVATVATPRATPSAALPGPDAFGRNLVIRAGATPPPAWADARRFAFRAEHLETAGAAELLAELRPLFASRARFVVELHVPFPAPAEIDDRPPHELGPMFELVADALHHVVWANSIDATGPVAVWPLAERAIELGATPGVDGCDVVLPDGRPAWCDGGPLRHPGELDTLGAVVPAVALEHGPLVPFGPNSTTAALADDQLAAVCHTGGASRIIAPAGSGKTRVLTERARLLLDGWHLPAAALCLVAFNKRAQEEMEERTTDLPALRVRTLNALGLAILNGQRPFAPRARRHATIDEPEVRRILSRLVKLPKRRNVDPLATWLEALSAARLGLRAPERVEDAYDGELPGFAATLGAYRGELARRGVVDFDEQILGAVELLLTDPVARRTAQQACRILLVDELQDLTPAHVLLVRLVAAPGGEVFGVGDDDQTIYGYNGADPRWLIDFEQLFPGAGNHPLEVNYRCPEGVVTAADTLLRHNRRRVPKVIRAAKTGRRGWEAVVVDDPPATTVATVVRLLDEGARSEDVAVLSRVNVVLAPVQVALSEHGLPVRAAVGPELLDRTAVRATLAWLRLAQGSWDSRDLSEVLRRPSRSLSPRLSEWVAEQHDGLGLRRLAARLRDQRDTDRVEALAADIEAVTNLARRSTAEVLDHLFDVVGLAPAVSTLDVHRHGMNRTAQADDLDALRWLARLHPEATSFETWLRQTLSRPSDRRGVTLATVHKVKGQEWPHVVVHQADASQLPHRLAEDAEEERRIFHVAITRAIESVTIVAGRPPSPFLAELTTEPSASPPVSVAATPEPSATRRPPKEPVTGALADALRALRHELRDGKPAYTVFDDDTLRAIVASRPGSLTELGRIRGIGPKRLELYGDRILAVVDTSL